MKNNIIDIRTRKAIPEDVPRNTQPGGIFIPFQDLILAISTISGQQFLTNILSQYAESIKIPKHELNTMIFIFDSKNSKKFLVDYIKDKSEFMFAEQLYFE
jgi:hypothetical protein